VECCVPSGSAGGAIWYQLTEAGAELGPVVDALSWWGMRHAWRPPRPGEPLRIEHLLRANVEAIAHTRHDREPACRQLDFGPDGRYVIRAARTDGAWRTAWAHGRRT
jgi:hypothetical protein